MTGKNALPIADDFEWDEQRDKAAVLLAQGYNNAEAAREIDVHRSTVKRWRDNPIFEKEIDRLSVMYGVASKAHRLRLLNQAIRQMIDEKGKIDLEGVKFIDLIKEARMQTEGLQLGILNQIAAVNETPGLVAGTGQDRLRELPEADTEEGE